MHQLLIYYGLPLDPNARCDRPLGLLSAGFLLLEFTGEHALTGGQLQLGDVHLDGGAADMNVSAIALAAVAIAATALDSALLGVERTVERSQQLPEASPSTENLGPV